MNNLLIKEALRIFLNRFKKTKSYSGNASEICRQIVKDCWNGNYFQVSNGNFAEFYTRDFAYCIESLIKLGYKKEAEKTLNYALAIFSKNNKITTTITKNQNVVDVFNIAPDSLALLIKSIKIIKNKFILEKYENFLIKEIYRYFKAIVDEKTGLAKRNRYFSSAKDHCIRDSSCYDNCMLAFLRYNLSKLGLENPFKSYNYKRLIKENFWTGDYFKDDLSSNNISSDANIYPYWLNIFNSRKMIKLSIASIQSEQLDKPFPIKYTKEKKGKFLFPQRLFVLNYEGNTIWAHHGLNFIKIVSLVNKQLARTYLDKYKNVIEKHKTFIEVFNSDGTPYKTSFYKADKGMLWASNYLTLEGIKNA